MLRDELALWLRLSLTRGIGHLTAHRLLKNFGLPEAIFSQSYASLTQVVSGAQAHALLSEPDNFAAQLHAACDWQYGASPGVMRRMVHLADVDYPRVLLQMSDAPICFYVMGNADVYAGLVSKKIATDLAMVGSRHATAQGLQNAQSFAKDLTSQGFCIVSGMALGIDGAAHTGALQAPEGTTIAVVGTGLDRVYPKRHLELAHRIAERGLIMSEFPLGTPPLAENFPRRNRIIAALSQGTLVVEAAVESGSLITARQAAEMGKEVLAIPGSIHNPQSRGCHALIKQGAQLVETVQDVIDALPHKPSIALSQIASIFIADCVDSTREKQVVNIKNDLTRDIFEALGHDAVSLDALIARTGADAATLQVHLLEWELSGEVARLPGGLFQRLYQA